MDYSGPTYDEAALSQPSTITGPTDPGVAGTYVDGQFVPSEDTITSFTQNLKAEYASNPLSFLLSPLGQTAKVAGQTLAANYRLGNLPSFSIGGGTCSYKTGMTFFRWRGSITKLFSTNSTLLISWWNNTSRITSYAIL
jgi:hypothetical protein